MLNNKINLLFDASVIANSLEKNRGRSGIFFVSINILKELIKKEAFNVELYSNLENYGSLCKVVKNDVELADVKIATPYSKLDWAIIHFLNLKKKNKENKEGAIFRIFIKLGLSIVKLIHKIINPKVDLKLLEKYDVFFSSYEKIPDFIAECKHIKKYTMLHDITPILFPQYFEGGKDGAHWFSDFINSLNTEDYYFTNSEQTKRDFIKHIPHITPSKITTALLAAGDDFYPCRDENKLQEVCKKYNIPSGKKYLFSLCSLEPRKNLILAVKAFFTFIEKHKLDDFVYVLGGGAWERFIVKMEKELPELASHSNKIIRAGYIDDEDLSTLYSNSEFFVYTSEYEGFGLPPLEAMKCGTAVLTSNNSSLPEVVGDSGIMIDFNSLEQHIEAFEKLYFDKEFRATMEQKAIERAKQFSWQKCANIIADEMAKN